MVVLEGANATMPMLTIGNNQYLQPDYLSPNPSMVRILINFHRFFATINCFARFINSWIRRKARWHCSPRHAPKLEPTRTTLSRSPRQRRKAKNWIRKLNRNRRQTRKKWIKLTSWFLSRTRRMC